MTRRYCPALILLMAATIPAPGAGTGVRTVGVAAQTMSINGVACLEVVGWSGGDAIAEVVLEQPTAGTITKKHLGSLAYDSITVEAAFPLSQTLRDCIGDLCANRVNGKTLLLTNLDQNGRVVGVSSLRRCRRY